MCLDFLPPLDPTLLLGCGYARFVMVAATANFPAPTGLTSESWGGRRWDQHSTGQDSPQGVRKTGDQVT